MSAGTWAPFSFCCIGRKWVSSFVELYELPNCDASQRPRKVARRAFSVNHFNPTLPDRTRMASDILGAGVPAMNLEEFQSSLSREAPPADLGPALAGLWWDAKGDWAKAHESAQQDEGPTGAWVHAYLHRKEGDATNAAYWYQRAGKSEGRGAFEQEWEEIAAALVA